MNGKSQESMIQWIGESTLFHGKHALRFCLESGLGDLVLAFAYESIARAFSILSDDIKKKVALEKARTK